MVFLKVILAPGSLSLLTLALAAGAIAIARSRRVARASRIWIAAWVAMYFLLSLPMVAHALYEGLASRSQAFAADTARDAQAVVLLSGGGARYRLGGEVVALSQVPTTLRVLEAARVYRMLASPVVVMTGASFQGAMSAEVHSMRAELLAAGVPEGRVVMEVDSRDTYQSAIATRNLLEARGIRRTVLVTSAQHIPRAMRAFRAAGLDVVAAPAPLLPSRPGRGWRTLVPDAGALTLSQVCLHEYVGLLYYALRGWT